MEKIDKVRLAGPVTVLTGLGVTALGMWAVSTARPDAFLPPGVMLFGIGGLIGLAGLVFCLVVTICSAIDLSGAENRRREIVTLLLNSAPLVIVSLGVIAAIAAGHRGLGHRAAYDRDAPRVISSAFGLDEDCQLNDRAWHSTWSSPRQPDDGNGAQGMAPDFGRTADPNGIIFSCGQGTRAQPCYLLLPRYYACYLPNPGDARYGQWACVLDEDGQTSRLDRYRDFWNAPPCRAAMEKAGFHRGRNGSWWFN
jgi:hypothetical protein